MSASATSALHQRLRAATIGRYDVYAELGQGGMATVFLALDLALDRKVAIKVLNPALASSPENVERFRREAKVAASLSHPNIIGIHAVGDDPELAYFVMKYVEGRALDSVVREAGALAVPFVRGVIAAAGNALQYAHSRGIVHRDVKPANLMLDRDGWLIVTDFGIAKLEDKQGLTITGSVIGTPYYMAPEQFQGQPVTAAADQYALGVVAFELLTGRQPFAGDTIGEVMKGHLFDPIPAVRELRPDVPEEMDAAITRMLAKLPADRFPSMADAVAAFGQVTPTLEHEVRTQIIKLAESGAREQPRIAVPVSPSPAVRKPTPPTPAASVPAAAPAAPTRAAHPLRTAVLIVVGLLVGGLAATYWLRPDLVNKYRKQFAGPSGNAADTGTFIRGVTGQTAPEDTLPLPAAAADAAKRAQAERDSIERAVAAAIRDSIARADSMRRALAASQFAAAERQRPPRGNGRNARDAAPTAARRDEPLAQARDTTPPVVEQAVPAPMPPQTIPGSFVYGKVLIGSRCPTAVLYVGESDVRAIGGRGLQELELSGAVTLRIRTRAGADWDTTFTVASGSTHRIGFRPIRCT